MFRRRTVLALMIVGVVPAFAVVNLLVAAGRSRREAISAEWARRGDIDLADRRAAAAAEDYETADQYARDRGRYRLQLADALLGAGRRLEAEAQLLALWNGAPGNGAVNLQLARLCAAEGRVTDAVRYYHAAIDGAWESDAARARRDVRLELARFLLANGQRTQAEGQLIAIAGELPPNATDPDVAALAAEIAFDIADAALSGCDSDDLAPLRAERDALNARHTPASLRAFALKAVDAVEDTCGDAEEDQRAIRLLFPPPPRRGRRR